MTEKNTSPDTESAYLDTAGAAIRKMAAAMLRYALWPTGLVVVAAIVIGYLVTGISGAVGAVLGGLLAVIASGVGLWVFRKTAEAQPMVVMAAFLVTFASKLLIFALLLILLRGTTLFDIKVFGFTLLAAVIAWLGGELAGFLRTRIPTVIPE